jgi:uncharacterized protein (UPF0333 family)
MNNSKKIIIAVVVLALVGVGIFFALNQNGSQKQLSAFDKLEKAFLLQTEIKKADIDIVYGKHAKYSEGC